MLRLYKKKTNTMKTQLEKILSKTEFQRDDVIRLLSAEDDLSITLIQQKAGEVLLTNCGHEVYFRGLIEFSNICVNDCDYCGIRKSNAKVKRFQLTKTEIVDTALWCAEQGYGSVVLQSGERQDPAFVDFVEDCIRTIKELSSSDKLPNGLGITLCVGEQTEEVYRRFFDAGAHRYLLRIETSSPGLYSEIHAEMQSAKCKMQTSERDERARANGNGGQEMFERRVECLRTLRKVGFQVGTGVMIGLPGQTIEDLADDILFFKDMDIDMIGMGPYIPHADTPMGYAAARSSYSRDEAFRLAVRMIAVTRIVLRDVNIAATTALQALHAAGREMGLQNGANVIMPQATPRGVRGHYLLYEGKPCLDESAGQCATCLRVRVESVGRSVGYDKWGDSRRAQFRAARA